MFCSNSRRHVSEGEVCCEGYGKFSRLVTSHVDVKQGYTLYPKLFCLFVNDLNSLFIFGLVFADDASLMADSRDNLQKKLDIMI